MGNFLDEIVKMSKFEGDDPASQMFGRPQVPGPGANETALLNLYQGLIKQTDPLRKRLVRQSDSFLKKGMNFDVAGTPQFMAARDMANLQAQGARDSILENMPSGGVLLDKLADVDIDKARNLTQVGSNIFENEFNTRRNQAMSLATGGPFQAGAQGMGQLAQMDVAREQSAAAQQAGQKSGLGAAIGGAAGSK